MEAKRKQEIVKIADSLSVEGVAQGINDLRIEINKMLAQIAERLEEQTNKYQKTQDAIVIKNKDLLEIYEIEKSAFTLAALLETHKHKERELTTELENRKRSLEEEIKAIRQDWEKERKEHTDAIKERDTQEQKIREREKEEYLYTFQREQQLAENKFKDDLKKLENEIAVKKEAADKAFSEREKFFKEREAVIQDKEQQFLRLQQEVEVFPKRLDEAVAKAVADTKTRLEAEAKKNETLLRKEYEGERNVLTTKIDSLQSVVADQVKQIAGLSEKLERAYGKVQDIAVKAVEGSANINAFTQFRQATEKTTDNPRERFER